VARYAGLFTSPNGVDWTPRLFWYYLEDVTYGDHLFVAVGANNSIFTSPDGVTWTLRALNLETRLDLTAVTYGDGLFVAVEGSGTILTSP